MISNLQVLRGLAALAVAFYHTGYLLPGGAHTEFEGVLIFFVISGFIMSYISKRDCSFLINRLIRIIPLYWLATIFFLVWSHVGSGQVAAVLTNYPFQLPGFLWSVTRELLTPSSIIELIESLLFIPYKNSGGQFEPVLGVGWTLNYEMFFYCLFSISIIVNRRLAPIIVGAVLIGITSIDPKFAYLQYFLDGIAVYYAWTALDFIIDRSTEDARKIGYVAVLFICTMAIPLFIASNIGIVPFSWNAPAGIVLLVLIAHSLNARCEFYPLMVLGDASYSLYLTHLIVLVTLSPYVDFTNSVGGMLATVIAMVVFAVVIHRRIELPVIRSLRRRAFSELTVSSTKFQA